MLEVYEELNGLLWLLQDETYFVNVRKELLLRLQVFNNCFDHKISIRNSLVKVSRVLNAGQGALRELFGLCWVILMNEMQLKISNSRAVIAYDVHWN